MSQNPTPTTFREAYDTLQGHAETLRRQSEPNIDDLLEIVNESVTAYKVCKARIDAVEKALEEALAQVDGAPAASAPAAPVASAPAPAPAPAPARPAARRAAAVPAPAPTPAPPPPPPADAPPDVDMDDDDIPF